MSLLNCHFFFFFHFSEIINQIFNIAGTFSALYLNDLNIFCLLRLKICDVCVSFPDLEFSVQFYKNLAYVFDHTKNGSSYFSKKEATVQIIKIFCFLHYCTISKMKRESCFLLYSARVHNSFLSHVTYT